jgi:hypothetical protein
MDPGWILAALALASAFFTIIGLMIRSAWRTFRKADDFLEDWNGRKETSSHAAIPGAIERIRRLEQLMSAVNDQVQLDSGRSLKDAVIRTESAVEGVKKQLDDLSGKVSRLSGGNP